MYDLLYLVRIEIGIFNGKEKGIWLVKVFLLFYDYICGLMFVIN